MTIPHVQHGVTTRRDATSARRVLAGRGRRSKRRVVEWSPSYVAFLLYVFVTTTYRLNLGTASMVAALALLPFEPRPLRLPPPVLWAVAFLVWAVAGWTGTAYPDTVWTAVTDLAKICAIMFVAVNVLTTTARLRFFMLAFLAFFAFYPVRGALFSYFIYHGNVEGRAAWNYVYANPNDLASLCLLPLSFSIGMFFSEPARWVRYCAAAGAVILPFIILLTQSRGAFVALAVFALLVLKGQKQGRTKILLLAGAAAVVIALAAPSSVWTRLATITQVTSVQSAANVQDEGSARQRLEIWRVARTIFAEHPVTGVGLGAYSQAHYVYALRPAFNPTARGFRDAHSTYFRLLAETGLVGFLLFFGMVGSTVYDAERTRRRAKFTHPARATQLFYMDAGLFGYFVAGIWGSYSAMVLTYVYLAVLYAMTQALKAELPAPERARQRRPVRVARAGRLRASQVAS